MTQPMITTARDLSALCDRLAGVPSIAFDTEFVSEHTYRSQLCLVQVAAGDDLVAIDALAIEDMKPFWELVASPGHETIVHAGREELVFCLDAVGCRPHNLVDVQLAAALIGSEYPAGYGTLVSKVLGEAPEKGETRTDWRKRPLSDRQISYALADVKHLHPLRDKILGRLAQLNRMSWFEAEMGDWQRDVEISRGPDRWRRVAGSSGLSSRSLAIVRELWHWREREAQRRNCPVRQVLRDDLIAELAKRRSADPKQIRAIRGMERGDLQRASADLSECIAKALEMPEDDVPRIIRRDTSPQLTMLGQFLSSALSSICREREVATSLVGTANDVRELVAHHLGEGNPNDPPALTQGWRAEVVGNLLDDLLSGKVAIRITNPTSEQPLAFEPVK